MAPLLHPGIYGFAIASSPSECFGPHVYTEQGREQAHTKFADGAAEKSIVCELRHDGQPQNNRLRFGMLRYYGIQ